MTGGGYVVRFRPDDGEPVVLAREGTVAAARNAFALHRSDLDRKGARGWLVLANARGVGRFAGGAIREERVGPRGRPSG